ncbi:antitoxin [Rhodoferax sp.]|uniref:antitoxin n=1 Tax=Rhodoferax sp. TaxID=50421 RepID=UPI00273174F6|nr:AbrB/MazE/SpoVT family DNA-binding domain-containing protein [Rhodoferax sp.]MDP1528808.1 AbrB/MazE/SpoVT family DNA-binding domain-containing protein [Rhodoferax sp.]MDP1943707.1 AbrB/MazE/SpoVT family DNA-binding domain-containing protein [Rhodoferax sp.]MDP2440856.1 AbrB/MazE/SpoVT family DNA-binding domain-containing protein [Rhodoferax sp.]MDP3192599.1 AbrB/MazE/SpoVT family DNA-binding domain-containing protein [Rhodoferax sp.]MDP3337130.1 AbrB/MazE/SpoVT family DNA-binding domain-con
MTTTTAAVFMSGNSQAVRLPKEFQLHSKRVFIERRGDEIILREKKATVRDILRGLPPLSLEAAQAWAGVEAQTTDASPQGRDWTTLLASDAAPSK